MNGSVVVIGAAGPLGRRVVQLAATDPGVTRVIAIDRPGVPAPTFASPSVELHALELTDPDLKQRCEGAASIVHLGLTAADDDDDLDGTGSGVADVEGTRHLLAAAVDAGVPALVVLSSAMVYGAWPNNPVPLTEDAPLRPDPALPFASRRAEVERLVAELREERSAHGETAITVAVLRPTVAVDGHSGSWLAKSPWSAVGLQVHDAEPPVQFVHLDDLAAAADLARRSRLDGPFNVAPDGWIPAEQLRALSGPAPRLHVPAPLAEKVAALRWRFGMTGTPPSVLPYRMHAWVISNDRLRAAGWVPTYSNEEAYVEADRGGPLASLNPRRKQMLSLGAVGLVAAAIVAGAVVLLRRRSRRP